MTTKITAPMLSANENDDFRSAIQALGRTVMPAMMAYPKSDTHINFDPTRYYYSDLMYDAIRMANMRDGEYMWLILTPSGTHNFLDRDEAVRMMGAVSGMTMLRVRCTNPTQEYLPRTWKIDVEAAPTSAALRLRSHDDMAHVLNSWND